MEIRERLWAAVVAVEAAQEVREETELAPPIILYPVELLVQESVHPSQEVR